MDVCIFSLLLYNTIKLHENILSEFITFIYCMISINNILLAVFYITYYFLVLKFI
jgi:hypothetical protein